MSEKASIYHKIMAAVRMRVGIHPAMLRAVGLARSLGGEVALVHAMEKMETVAPTPEMAHRRFEELKATYPQITSTHLEMGPPWNVIVATARQANADLVAISTHTHSQLAALVGTYSDQVLHHADRDVLVTRTERYTADQVPGNYRHILLAVDLQENHRTIAERAVALADHQGAHLSLLHVVDHYPALRDNNDIYREDVDPFSRQKHIKGERLASLAQSLGAVNATLEVLVTSEAAHHAIPPYAKEKGVDLIVIGAHKPSTLDRLLGSIADHVVHHAPCDVLVVHIPS